MIYKVVQKVFPDKHIGPATFRRLVPSLLFDKQDELDLQGKSMQDFFHDYANLVNTSVKVFKLIQN